MFTSDYGFGGQNLVKKLPIVSTTAIELGEIVKFTPAVGIVAVAGTDFDDPFLGISLQAHDGVSTNETGEEIAVTVAPDAIYSLKTKSDLTLTGGSTTTAVISGLLPQTDNLWIGGYIEVVAMASNANLKGRMYKITDSTGSTGSLLIDEIGSAFASGDTIRLHAGKAAIGEYGWDLDSDGTDIDYETSGGEALILIDANPKEKTTFWKPRLAQFGNDSAAK